jgi:hypothetical protein
VTVNGEKVGEVPLTMGKWVYGMRVDLPRDKLRKNQKNVIAFVSTQNPPAADEWEICYVQITQEAIPPPDAAKARLEFELGRKSYEDRDLDPGNLADALERFRKVRDYLELLPDKPESYREALDYIEKADAELTQRFQDGLFSARRAEKVEYKPEEAKQILRRTLRHFRKDDFRRREIKQQIDRLERGR